VLHRFCPSDDLFPDHGHDKILFVVRILERELLLISAHPSPLPFVNGQRKPNPVGFRRISWLGTIVFRSPSAIRTVPRPWHGPNCYSAGSSGNPFSASLPRRTTYAPYNVDRWRYGSHTRTPAAGFRTIRGRSNNGARNPADNRHRPIARPALPCGALCPSRARCAGSVPCRPRLLLERVIAFGPPALPPSLELQCFVPEADWPPRLPTA